MSQFSAAVRQLLESELRCPSCDAMNTPNAKPTIELSARNEAWCSACGHSFVPTHVPTRYRRDVL